MLQTKHGIRIKVRNEISNTVKKYHQKRNSCIYKN